MIQRKPKQDKGGFKCFRVVQPVQLFVSFNISLMYSLENEQRTEKKV